MTRWSLAVFAAFWLLAPLAACQARTGLPEEYLGRWYFAGTSGGIDGGGTGEPAVGWIVITDGNEIEHYDDGGNRTSTEAFELERGQSIYSGGEAWVLGAPDEIQRVIQLYEDGTMAISDNAYDGYSSHFQRTPVAR